jgi:hypothetical protein
MSTRAAGDKQQINKILLKNEIFQNGYTFIKQPAKLSMQRDVYLSKNQFIHTKTIYDTSQMNNPPITITS